MLEQQEERQIQKSQDLGIAAEGLISLETFAYLLGYNLEENPEDKADFDQILLRIDKCLVIENTEHGDITRIPSLFAKEVIEARREAAYAKWPNRP
jgi:hypothetical protein